MLADQNASLKRSTPGQCILQTHTQSNSRFFLLAFFTIWFLWIKFLSHQTIATFSYTVIFLSSLLLMSSGCQSHRFHKLGQEKKSWTPGFIITIFIWCCFRAPRSTSSHFFFSGDSSVYINESTKLIPHTKVFNSFLIFVFFSLPHHKHARKTCPKTRSNANRKKRRIKIGNTHNVARTRRRETRNRPAVGGAISGHVPHRSAR